MIHFRNRTRHIKNPCQTLPENLGIFHRLRSFSQGAFEALDHGLGYMYSDPTRKDPGNQMA
jgi:hypothetical protein